MKHQFLISDESVNSCGTWVLSQGIRTQNYEKNPIILWNHIRAYSDKEDQILPIGKCTKIWKEGESCFAEVEFDPSDAFALKIAKKVENGIIRACSISIDILATSEDEKCLKQGQTRPTIIESSLREISVVDIPSNKNCVKLYDQGKEINFSDTEQEHFLLPLINKKNMNFKTEIENALALNQASEEQILVSLKAVIAQNKQALQLKEDLTQANAKVADFEDKEKQAQSARITDLVEKAIADKKILTSQKQAYIALAQKDFENTKEILHTMSQVSDLSEGNPKEESQDPWETCFNDINKNKQRN